VAPRLLIVSDRRACAARGRTLAATLGAALAAAPAGAVEVLLREKDLAADALRALAIDVAAACRSRAPLWIHAGGVGAEAATIAREVGAIGVHLPEGAAPFPTGGLALGRSTHGPDGAAHAAAEGAALILCGPVFATPSKAGLGEPIGVAAIAEAARRVGAARLVAIGGVDRANAASLLAAGATGVAVIRAVMDAVDPATATAALLTGFRS
jgi:thiamine-phosphate pyrophosphorylase